MFTLERFHGETDFALYSKLVFNEAVMRMNMGRVFTPQEARCFYQMILECSASPENLGYFKVGLSEGGPFMGLCAIERNEEFDAAEIEYMLLPEYWHKGYGSALVTRLLELAHSALHTHRVIAITDPENVFSRRILLKHGFSSQKTYINPDGEPAELFLKST